MGEGSGASHQKTHNTSIEYLTLDVLETECPVLSRKHWSTCGHRQFYPSTASNSISVPSGPSMVLSSCEGCGASDFGQCKTVMSLDHFQNRKKLHGYNCTMSPVPPHLYPCKDCPVKVTVLQDTEEFAEAAKRILGKYKQESNETRNFMVEKVQKVFSAVASRTVYIIEFTIKEAVCPSSVSPAHESECGPCRRAHMGFCRGKVLKEAKDPDGVEVESCEIYNIHENTIITATCLTMNADFHQLDHHGIIIVIIIAITTMAVATIIVDTPHLLLDLLLMGHMDTLLQSFTEMVTTEDTIEATIITGATIPQKEEKETPQNSLILSGSTTLSVTTKLRECYPTQNWVKITYLEVMTPITRITHQQDLRLVWNELQFIGPHPAHYLGQAPVQYSHCLTWIGGKQEVELGVISILMTLQPKPPDDLSQQFHVDIK
ncbi:Histidine-rich glycoprotein [Varanus komodoensis]|nr:Histidine-rich glycoprotein [Varanus komodoensis]